MRLASPIVLKFGGAALDDPTAVARAVRAARTKSTPVVVVASARRGVTDRLQAMVADPHNLRAHARALGALRRAHAPLSRPTERLLEQLETEVRGLRNRRPPSGPTQDRIVSFGERLAVHWLADRLRDDGLAAEALEADRIGLRTGTAHGVRVILIDRSRQSVRRRLRRTLNKGSVPVLTGFIGRDRSGRVATLGRGGSDYSAAAVGALLAARRTELIKQSVSIHTADPSEVPTARPVRFFSYSEAEELAQFGARVLHPLTIEPARQAGIRLTVRSLVSPEQTTTIGPPEKSNGVRALTSLHHLHLLRLKVPGGRQRPGVVAELSGRLAAQAVNMVALFTSSALLSVVVEGRHGRRAREALEPMARDSAAVLEGPVPVTLVTAIGDGVLSGFDRWPREVMRWVEGFSATPRSLSVAVPERHGHRALVTLHRLLVETPVRP